MSSSQNVAELKATFARWDTDGSGSITGDELFAIFKALDPTFMQAELDEMMAEADVNKDGKIDINEFIDWCTNTGAEDMFVGELWVEKWKRCKAEALEMHPGWQAKMEKHWDQIKARLESEAFDKNCVALFMQSEDDNNDGLIDYQEVKDLIEPTLEMLHSQDSSLKRKKVTEEQIKAAFDAHDTAAEGKGKMGKGEFGNLIKYLQVLGATSMINETVSMWEAD